MTAFLCIQKTDAIELLSDAAWYRMTDGVVEKIASKIEPFPGGVITGRGNMAVMQSVALRARELGLTFDGLVAAYDDIMSEVEAIGRRHHGQLFDNHELFLAGWSESRGAPEMYFAEGHGRDADFPDRKLHQVCGAFVGGVQECAEPLRAAFRAGRASMDAFDMATNGMAILEGMRRTRQSLSDFVEGYGVGGFAELTVAKERSIERSIVDVWPDKIGKRIGMPEL